MTQKQKFLIRQVIGDLFITLGVKDRGEKRERLNV
jgi:hypothetical protein